MLFSPQTLPPPEIHATPEHTPRTVLVNLLSLCQMKLSRDKFPKEEPPSRVKWHASVEIFFPARFFPSKSVFSSSAAAVAFSIIPGFFNRGYPGSGVVWSAPDPRFYEQEGIPEGIFPPVSIFFARLLRPRVSNSRRRAAASWQAAFPPKPTTRLVPNWVRCPNSTPPEFDGKKGKRWGRWSGTPSPSGR